MTGGFSSGSTLLFTLFRKTREYRCLYEPLHEKLLEYLIFRLRVNDRHFFVDNYFEEYRGFREIPKLFRPEWGYSQLYLRPDEEAPELRRYLSYLIETSLAKSDKVMMKENRLPFRLGWTKANFPQAKIVHVHREKRSHWNSIVKRVQAYRGSGDVGQERVDFNGFNIARWCEDLKHVYPELDARNFSNGYDRFCALWDLSFAENERYSDISVEYAELLNDFEPTFERIRECVGGNFEVSSLKPWIIPKEKQPRTATKRSWPKRIAIDAFENTGRMYARGRLRARALRTHD